jgi:serine/threonine protein kinase
MSPEQVEGKEVDGRADIWAVGCVLYEALSGRRAFGGETAAVAMAAVMKEEPQALQNVLPALERVVKTCLAKDREERFQSARDLRRALDWMGEEAVSQRPRPRVIFWAVTALFAAFAFTLALWHFRGSPSEQQAIKFTINPPGPSTRCWPSRWLEPMVPTAHSGRLITTGSASSPKGS